MEANNKEYIIRTLNLIKHIATSGSMIYVNGQKGYVIDENLIKDMDEEINNIINKL